MSDIKQMVGWLKESIKSCEVWPTIISDPSIIEWARNSGEMMRAILAALEPKPDPLYTVSWMKLAEELNVPFSAVKAIRDKIELDMEGPSEGEIAEAIKWIDEHLASLEMGYDLISWKGDTKQLKIIRRALIQGNPAPGKEEK